MAHMISLNGLTKSVRRWERAPEVDHTRIGAAKDPTDN